MSTLLDQINPFHFVNRIKSDPTPDNIISITTEFVQTILDAYERSPKHGKAVVKFFKRTDRMAQSIARASEGIDKGYRLVDNWFQIIFAQLAMIGESLDENRDTSRSVAKETALLYTLLGWNVEDAINPTYDDTRTIIKGFYNEIPFNLILQPTDDYPVGAMLKLKKNNDLYQVTTSADNGDYLVVCQFTGKVYPYTRWMLEKAFERIS